MLITTAIQPTLAPRAINPLSVLVSEAIELGTSVLGEILQTSTTPPSTTSTPSTPSAFTTSSSPSATTTATSSPLSTTSSSLTPFSSPLTSTPSSTTTSISFTPNPPSSFVASQPASSSIPVQAYIAPTSTSLPLSQSSAVTPSFAPSAASAANSGHHGTNKTLIVVLSVVIGLLGLLLLAGLAWLCLRRRNRKQRHENRVSSDFSEQAKKYSLVDDDGLHATSDWYDTKSRPQSLAPLVGPMTMTRPISRSDPSYSPVNSPISPDVPVMSPLQAHPIAPHHHLSYVSAYSSDLEDTPYSSHRDAVEGPADVPCEVEGDAGDPLVRHPAQIPRAIWPSRTESLKFDFGFRPQSSRQAKRPGDSNYTIPRRPLSRATGY